MNAIIVCVSLSHGNTRRVADAMAEVLAAKVVTPSEADPAELAASDLVGFGSGVRNQKLYPELTDFARSLPLATGRAFVFATSGFPEFLHFTRPLVEVLRSKGYAVAPTFTCRAYDTWAPLKLVGGVNKNRPNAEDLTAARTYAEHLRTP
jgi:flavodoxin